MVDICLYTAPLILPLASAPLYEGAIVVQDNIIAGIGPRDEIVSAYPDCKVVRMPGVLMPSLINCHTHLELSYFEATDRPVPDTTMVSWISRLVSQRIENTPSQETVLQAAKQFCHSQVEGGVSVVVDIGNETEIARRFNSSQLDVISLVEVIAPDKNSSDSFLKQLAGLPDSITFTPHAPYSTSGDVIIALKERASRIGSLFSIHLAESPEENVFVRSRTGPFRDFLQKRNRWNDNMLGRGNYRSSVDYLNQLGVLDENTLCIHCVQVDDEDIHVLKDTGAKVCFCPGSNRYLRVGKAPVAKILDTGILPCLGTDSSASNPHPDMWSEMMLLRKEHSSITPQQILTMATRGGAEALSNSRQYGELAHGKVASILHIEIDNIKNLTADEVMSDLVSHTTQNRVNWIAVQ